MFVFKRFVSTIMIFLFFFTAGETSMLFTPDPAAASEVSTRFIQGAGYQSGAYDLNAAQPTAIGNWSRQSRFNGPSKPPMDKWANVTLNSSLPFSPSVTIGADGTIYTSDGSALNPDGSLKWQKRLALTPAIAADGTLYYQYYDGNQYSDTELHALNPNGSIKWTSPVDVHSTPAIGSDGTLYVNGGDELSAVNPDGTTKWVYSSIAAIGNTTPAIASDGTIYVSGSVKVYAINPDGTLKWEFDTPDNCGGITLAQDGTLYFGTGGGIFYAVNSDGTLKWTQAETGTVSSYISSSAPAVANDGTIYFAASKDLIAINPDGSRKWRFTKTLTSSSYAGRTSPLVGADGTIYFVQSDYNLYAVTPEGTEKWHYRIESLESSPALGADGTLYVDVHHAFVEDPKPQPPTNIKASATRYDQINLSWDPVEESTSYKVYRSTITSSHGYVEYTEVGTTTDSSFTDMLPESSTGQWWYKISGVNDNGTGVQSTPVQAWVNNLDRTAPTVNNSATDTHSSTPQTITLEADEPADIYYTTDVDVYPHPYSSSSQLYSGPITIAETTTLRYIAVDKIGNISSTYSIRFVIDAEPPSVSVDVAEGIYWSPQTIRLTMNEGGTIYFTTDGQEPTPDSTVYSDPINLNRSTILKYMAVDYLGNRSAVYTQVYTIPNPPDVGIDVAPGSYNHPVTVTLSTNKPATIYYSLNEDTPNTLYTGPIEITESATLKAIAYDEEGFSNSPSQWNYMIDQTPPTATVNVPGGIYNRDQFVSLSSSEPGAIIYYSLNGLEPSDQGSYIYSQPIKIDLSYTLKYRVIDQVGNASPVYTQSYIIDKRAPVVTMSQPSGTYNTDQTVALTLNEEGKMYYTTDETIPTTASAEYKQPILISNSTTLRVVGVDTAGNQSVLYSTNYHIDKTPPIVTIDVPGGTYNAVQQVNLFSSESSSIYYTTNGDTPNVQGSLYTHSGSIGIDSNTVLKYIAVDLAGNISPVYTQSYIIDTYAPTVQSTEPSAGAVEVDQDHTIRINLNEEIKVGTDFSRIQVHTMDSIIPVNVSIDGNSLVITPKTALMTGTTYLVAIPKGAVQDLNGNALANDYSLNFTTKALNITRLGGTNRIQTAIKVSKEGWTNGADAVIIARGDNFPDALAGAPLAYKYNAPILLTDSQVLSGDTLAEIKRLKPKKIFILGSTGAISQGIENDLNKYLPNGVKRLGGTDRFDTARVIAEFLGNKGKAVIAYGYDFPDALAISPWAGYNGVPILLTAKDSIPAATRQALASLEVTETTVVGGTGIISQSVFNQLPRATRYSGNNRYLTALTITQKLGTQPDKVFVAIGNNFPDALAGSAMAAQMNSPIILIDQNISEAEIKKYMMDHYGQIKQVVVLGSVGVIPETTISSLVNSPGIKIVSVTR